MDEQGSLSNTVKLLLTLALSSISSLSCLLFLEQLIALISAAKQHNVEFIYAISPGLDITFSNPKEVDSLRRKLDQVEIKGGALAVFNFMAL